MYTIGVQVLCGRPHTHTHNDNHFQLNNRSFVKKWLTIVTIDIIYD